MTDSRPSASWSTFIATDTAKVATFVTLCALLIVGLQPASREVRFAQLMCSLLALACVAVLAYRDGPQMRRVRTDR